MNFNIIVATSNNNGIGINNTLPWKIKSDLKKFKTLTCGSKNNAIVMGKNTLVSINSKPLPSRDNLILSTSLIIDTSLNYHVFKSFNNIELLMEYINGKTYDEVWIIGGKNVYDAFLKSKKVDNIYITYIDNDYTCDTFFPTINTDIYKFVSQSIHKTEKDKFDFQILDRVYKRI